VAGHLATTPEPEQQRAALPAPMAGGYRADTTLIWAVPDRAPAGWRSVNVTSDGLRLPQDLRRSLPGPPRQLRTRTVTAAQPDDQPETCQHRRLT
jgi:hypothetical protein